MKKAYLNFSFDDGRVDTFNVAYPILKKYMMGMTLNATSGYIESGTYVDSNVTDIMPMDIKMLQNMASDKNVEIAGHGYKHKNTEQDIVKGISCLKKWLPNKSEWGFASPGTGLTIDYYHSIKEVLKSEGISYIRLSCRYLNHSRIKIFARKLARVTHLPILYRFAYQDTLMSEINDDILYSVPVLSDIKVGEIKSLIDRAVKRKQACVLMFHSIVDKSEVHDAWDYDKEKFEDICRFVNEYQREGVLEVTTSMNIYKLLIEDKDV